MTLPRLLGGLAATLAVAGQTVTLRVVDPHGLAVPSAAVEIRDGQGARVVVSGGDGAVAGIRSPADIRVAAVGFEPLVQRIESGASRSLEVRLRPAILRAAVEVVVRDEGEPLSPQVGTVLEIERGGACTVLDAVERLVASAFVTRRGVLGYGIATNGTGQVSLRGVGGSPNTEVLIVIDGRADVQGLMGHPLPDFYSLSEAASVAVTEGPASVRYGSNAMGGVIEIQPARPRHGSETQLSSELGSYLTGLHRLRHGGLRYDRHALCGPVVVPEFQASRNLSANYTVAGGVARGFRNPTIRELYLFPAPNPTLKPEHLWNYQASLHAHPRRCW